MRSLDEWLAYQAQLHPVAIDMGLERLRAVLGRLDWRRPDVPIIMVGGTNGKGSVSAFCTAILQAAGFRVGTFTSPHLRNYRERIHVADRNVDEPELIAAFERIEAARGGVGLTFFEYGTLAALLVFEAARLDAWVLEIGMGGRLDAVNVVDPDVTVVVSIGLDHQEYLGTTIEQIAAEKAGIFRRDKPAVLGGRAPSAVLEDTARAVGAPLKRLGIEYNFNRDGAGWRYRGTRWHLPLLPAPALRGSIQYANAATALAALEELGERMSVSAAAVAHGLQQTRLMGRFQVLASADAAGPSWILDVAHNEAAARVLADNLREEKHAGRTLAVCAILADKDAAGICAELSEVIDAWFCASIGGPRGRSGEALAHELRLHVNTPVAATDNLAGACEAAAACATPADRIVVFGSFYAVGPAIDWLESIGVRALS